MKKLDIFYFSSTHWDREWYQDFQSYRYRLVKMVDNLLDLFDSDPEYKTFHFDGQTVVLEDYAEIRPEKKEKLRSLISDRRILVGPWYVMPDEYLLSGESLIRNLMKGHELSKEWGAEPWKTGYVCDIFGHIAQMPQIFNGFNIKSSVLGRGTDEEAPSFINWRSPDGSECTNFVLNPSHGYGTFRYAYRFESDTTVNNPNIIRNIQAHVNEELTRSEVPVVILMDGLDHEEAGIHTTQYLQKLAELYPEANIHHIDLCEAFEKADLHKNLMPVVEGELNLTAKYGHSYLKQILNTLSSHYPLKQDNDRCQIMLEKIIEPIGVLAEFDGVKLNRNFIKTAYQYLLQNHPHDSICGCSIDQVHKDMEYRFDQVKEISNVFEGDYLNQTFRKDESTDEKGYSSILTLQNYLPYDVDKTVTVDIDFKSNFIVKYRGPGAHKEVNSFNIIDTDGNIIPYQVIDCKKDYARRIYNRAMPYTRDVYTVTFRAKMPAMAKVEYKVVPCYTASRYLSGRIKSGDNYAENEFIRVDILSNGSITVFDKKTGKTYEGLGNLVNDGEIGDGWFHESPFADIVVSSTGCSSTVSKVESGPDRCVFKVTRLFIIPAKLNITPAGKTRSEETVTLKIDTFIGLSSENRYVDVKLSYENTACDHRMRLMIPTGIDSDKYFAGQAFYCTQRDIGIPVEKEQYDELPTEQATNGIVGKRDKNGVGIAFVCAEGIHECASYNDDAQSLSVTLSRSFYKTYFTNGETRGQLNRRLDYCFAFAPIDSDVCYNDLLKIQDALSVKVPSNFATIANGTEPKVYESAVKVEGKNIAVSVIKRAESGNENEIIIRVFNASADNSKGTISIAKEIKKAEIVNLNEEYVGDISAKDKKLEISLSPWKIATYKLYI